MDQPATHAPGTKNDLDYLVRKASFLKPDGSLKSLEEIEGETIRFHIGHHKGNMAAVAKSLGIGRSTLYRRMEKFGLHVRRPRR